MRFKGADCISFKLFYNAKKLTKNEIGVINHLFRGLNGKAIAIKLNKSEKTISGQKRSAMKKLNVASTAELVNRFGIANSVDEFKIINIYRILYFVYFMK
ncbi:helix-turn-helix transcriptional regulator [Yersinia enterocolitica]|uniref:helix-turn-helix transcriptional regulator n=1 Tax=Yersinia enterocolitica TaxID=630 RepID=UPI00398C8795